MIWKEAIRQRVTWSPSNNLDSQLSHCGWGAFLAMFVSLDIGYIYCIGLVVLAAAKEFGFDIFEEKDSWAGSCLDFGVYCVGVGLGMFSAWIVTTGISGG